MIMFVIILVSVLRHRNRNAEASKCKKAAKNISVSLVLATMFGVGWIFGVLGSPALSFGDVVGGVFQYTFIAVAGFQGFMFFLLFPCRSKHAREVWKKWFYYATCRPRIYKENLRVLKTKSKGKYIKNSASTPADGNLKSCNPIKFSSAGNQIDSVANRFGAVPQSASSNVRFYEESGRRSDSEKMVPLGDPHGIELTKLQSIYDSSIDSGIHAVSSFQPTLKNSVKEQVGTSTPDKFVPLGYNAASPSYSSGSSDSPDSETCVVANYHAHDNEN